MYAQFFNLNSFFYSSAGIFNFKLISSRQPFTGTRTHYTLVLGIKHNSSSVGYPGFIRGGFEKNVSDERCTFLGPGTKRIVAGGNLSTRTLMEIKKQELGLTLTENKFVNDEELKEVKNLFETLIFQ